MSSRTHILSFCSALDLMSPWVGSFYDYKLLASVLVIMVISIAEGSECKFHWLYFHPQGKPFPGASQKLTIIESLVRIASYTLPISDIGKGNGTMTGLISHNPDSMSKKGPNLSLQKPMEVQGGMNLVIQKEGELCLLNRLSSPLVTFIIHAYSGAEIELCLFTVQPHRHSACTAGLAHTAVAWHHSMPP